MNSKTVLRFGTLLHAEPEGPGPQEPVIRK
jgi:hypothetical protein